MPADNQPTINDFLARLYTTRDAAADRLHEEMGALTTRHAARGLLRSGATLKALIGLIEKAFDAALTEMLAILRHMKSVPEIDYRFRQFDVGLDQAVGEDPRPAGEEAPRLAPAPKGRAARPSGRFVLCG